MILRIIFSCLCCFSFLPTLAQWQDSLSLQVESFFQAATQPYQPLWLIAGQDGKVEDRRYNFMGGVHLHQEFRKKERPWHFVYTASVYGRLPAPDLILPEAAIQFGFRQLSIRAGRWTETTGQMPAELSSGSLGISRNALPIPRIGIGTTDFVPVPFTKNKLQFQAEWFHGWMDSNRAIREVRLHQKSFTLRWGDDTLGVYAGLHHFVLWGGRLEDGTELPHSFTDFARLVMGASATNPQTHPGIPGELANALGDHRAVFDFGFRFPWKGHQFQMYTQSLFEKGEGTGASSRDRLSGLKIFSPDRIVGIHWEPPSTLFSQVTAEWIHTTYQGGDEVFVGRDNYYNNGLYQTGWNYQQRIIGTPLFFNQHRATLYDIPPNEAGGWYVVNNRVTALHAGMRGGLDKWSYMAKITYSENKGNYYNDNVFMPSRTQWYTLLGLEYLVSAKMSVFLTLVFDQGQLSNNYGLQPGFCWSVF